jgi:hypothetical protein
MSLSSHSGRHAYTWAKRPCDDPAHCAPTATAPPTETYWRCAACSRNGSLATLASTLRHYDDARAAQSARFKQPAMSVPAHTRALMASFRKLGGTVAAARM